MKIVKDEARNRVLLGQMRAQKEDVEREMDLLVKLIKSNRFSIGEMDRSINQAKGEAFELNRQISASVEKRNRSIAKLNAKKAILSQRQAYLDKMNETMTIQNAVLHGSPIPAPGRYSAAVKFANTSLEAIKIMFDVETLGTIAEKKLTDLQEIARQLDAGGFMFNPKNLHGRISYSVHRKAELRDLLIKLLDITDP